MILELTDFGRITEVYSKVKENLGYIDDSNVKTYYNKLLRNYDVNVDYAIDPISDSVKKYLIHAICVEVAYYSIGSNTKQIAENIVLDVWQTRYTRWKAELDVLGDDLDATDFYAPDNLPPVDAIGNPNVMEWDRS